MQLSLFNGKITIYPTKIVIDGYYETNKNLEYSLSVWDSVTFSYIFKAFIIDEQKNRITIPAGYPLNWLTAAYPNYEVVDLRRDIDKILQNKKYQKPINMKYDCRDEIQREAMKFLNHKYRNLKALQRFLCLKTGQGKTFCTVKYIADNSERPIIFVDNLTLGEQWIERIIEYSDTTKDEIYFISGKKSVESLLNMSEDEIYNQKFFICCYKTLTNIIKEEKSDMIVNLFNKINITLKVYDEAHVEYMSIFRLDMLSDVRTFYLSATPMRSDPKEDKVYQNMFRAIDHYSYVPKTEKNKKELDEEYHNIVICNWNSNPTYKDQFECATKYGFSMAKYCNYLNTTVYDRFESVLYDIIFNFILKNRKKKKLAILFGTNALLDKFYDNLITYIQTQGFKLTVGKLNGTVKKKDRNENLNNSDIIITTDKSFGKGIDVKDIQVLINTVPFSSESKLIQVVGRLRKLPKKEVFFFDLNDMGFDSIRYQVATKTNKVYKKLGKNILLKNY